MMKPALSKTGSAGWMIFFLVAAGLVLLTQCRGGTSPPEPNVETSWIGNTFGNADGRWVQMDARGMYVTPDGTVFTNTLWEEGAREAGMYRDGAALGQLDATHGYGRLGGYAVAANDEYVYAAMRQGDEVSPAAGYPPKGTTWYGVRRYRNDGAGTSAPFAGGSGYDGSMLITHALKNGSGAADLRGLAVHGDRLYVSDDQGATIRVYDANTMTLVTSWRMERPRQLAVEDEGNVWAIQGGNDAAAPRILRYSADGTLLPQRITDVEAPVALAVDNRGRLLVADNGRDQQIKIYDSLSAKPEQVTTLGHRGGISSDTPGEVAPSKFNGLTGVGSDGAGNIYVAYNGVGPNTSGTGMGLVLQSYSPDRRLNWELLGLEFVDNADVDPASDGRDVYTKNEHFRMDLDGPSGEQWSYVGHTVDRFKYPEDPRLNLGEIHASAPFVRRIQGKPFLFVTDMYSHFLQIYRFSPKTDGEIAIPSSLFAKGHYDGSWPEHQPPSGEWIWRDTSGDGAFNTTEYETRSPAGHRDPWGWWVDDDGDVWQAHQGGIRRFPLQGLDKHGNPIYTYASMETMPTPSPFDEANGGLQRLEYDPDKDVMYLGGYTADHPYNDWGQVGKVVARYDNWSKGNRTSRWEITLPYEDTDEVVGNWPKAMSVAGDKLFVAYLNTAEVRVFDAKTGNEQGTITPGPEVGSESGWIDIPYGIRAYQRSNGEYLIFVEEDAYAKVILYRWDGKTTNN